MKQIHHLSKWRSEKIIEVVSRILAKQKQKEGEKK